MTLCEVALSDDSVWWLRKLSLDWDGILHPIQALVKSSFKISLGQSGVKIVKFARELNIKKFF